MFCLRPTDLAGLTDCDQIPLCVSYVFICFVQHSTISNFSGRMILLRNSYRLGDIAHVHPMFPTHPMLEAINNKLRFKQSSSEYMFGFQQNVFTNPSVGL